MLLSLLLAASDPPGTVRGACDVDRAAMLALPERAFDQDLEGGWRPLAARARCRGAAADLIAAYRRAHPAAGPILRWHEGQLRALHGQTGRAIALFERSREPSDANGWNDYVDATIAFLRHDREALSAARARLAARPKPADWAPHDSQGRPVPIAWPMNLNVVDGLIRCFGKPYDKAYSVCTAPIRIRR
ncbi:MAG: hypothetical protein QOJ94_399 [Sphingomonadales bacterium]|jgi:hypothetical protein|nr:hypothetical protein [Sphingomonadales bacterium]